MKLERRAIQLGLRGGVLRQFATDWIVDIENITPFVAGQRQYVEARELDKLTVPVERAYPNCLNSLTISDPDTSWGIFVKQLLLLLQNEDE